MPLNHTLKNIMAADPNNGAAAKFLAIEAFHKVNAQISSEAYPLLEKAMVLAPKDFEICFFRIHSMHTARRSDDKRSTRGP